MDPPSGNRLTAITDDNHQPWLWFIQFFAIAFVSLAAGMRAWIKWRQAGWSDAVLLVAHLLYISYWIVLVFSLVHGLGKSLKVTTEKEEDKASKLLFASRILLVIILALAKLSTMFLIREIFTKDATNWWFRGVVVACAVQALVGSLLISVNCSPTHTLEGKDNTSCPANEPRWIVFTIFEALLEVVLVVPVTIIVLRLQTNFKNKLWAITVFVCRLVVWIPSWLHLDFVIKFIRHGRTNIGIVPTMVTEELWLALALISASIPTLMRVAQKFTTSGIALGTTVASSRDKTKETPIRSIKMGSVPNNRDGIQEGKSAFRPDYATNTTQIDGRHMKSSGEGASIGSNAESHVGILRQVDFDVSSETKGFHHT